MSKRRKITQSLLTNHPTTQPFQPTDPRLSKWWFSYTVQLDDGEVLAIKFDNVLQLVDAEVTGTSRDEYNGKSCRVTGFDAEQLRYTCDLGGGKVLGLALDKVILPAGARCRVVGLTSASGSKWNDHIGKVVEYDRVAGRYLLQLGGGNQLHIKPANARL